MLNIDKLNHTSSSKAIGSALDMLDKVSDHEPQVQPVALAMALLAMVRRIGADVGQVFTVANNILHSKDQSGPQFEAMRLYMQHEIK